MSSFRHSVLLALTLIPFAAAALGQDKGRYSLAGQALGHYLTALSLMTQKAIAKQRAPKASLADLPCPGVGMNNAVGVQAAAARQPALWLVSRVLHPCQELRP